MFIPVLALITIATKFEGGNLGRIEKVNETHWRVGAPGDKDQDGRNRQANWYYFRVDGATVGQQVTLDVIDLPGEYNYRANRGAITKDTPPVVSYDGKSWSHVTTFEYDAAEPKLRLLISPQKSTFWIAHVVPYTNQNLVKLRNDISKNAAFSEEKIGKSVQGRDMLLWTIASKPQPEKTVWLMFRQHSWETGSSWAGEGAVRELIANAALRKNVTWKIFPFADPDGVASGNVRFNVHGYDLNRNWDVENPEKMPEITAQRNAIAAWLKSGKKIDLFFSLHNTETGEYLEAAPHGGEYTDLAQRFFKLLVEQTSFHPTRPMSPAPRSTTAGMPGRMTVTQGLYRDFKLPGFLMEQRISYNEKLKKLPLPEDRMRFGAELVRVMEQVVR
jgi:hypothetical protein